MWLGSENSKLILVIHDIIMEGDIPKGLAVEGIKEWCVSVCRSDVTNSPSSFRVVRCTASGTFQTLELFLRSLTQSLF